MLPISGGARWRSGRASDSESRGPGFEPHKRHRVVSLSKAHLLPTVLVKPRKRWLRPDMTEKLLTGTLNLNTNISGGNWLYRVDFRSQSFLIVHRD